MIGGSFVAGWTYRDAGGGEVFRVIRFALPDGDKQYRPIHLAKDGWRIGDPSGPLPLYRLDELPAAGTVWVTEGEKAADAAREIGLVATTSAHGADRPRKPTGRRWPAGRLHPARRRRAGPQVRPGRGADAGEADAAGGGEDRRRCRGCPRRATWWSTSTPAPARPADAIRGEIEALAEPTPDARPPRSSIGGPVLTCLADVQPSEIRWLWPGRVPLGRITLLVGRPGEGKSFLTTDMAARVTTGTPWPDGSECPKGSVILISAEDDPGDTIRPRLDAHHADCRGCICCRRCGASSEDGKRHDVMFTLADVAALEAALKAHSGLPADRRRPDRQSFLGGDTDAHRDNEVRACWPRWRGWPRSTAPAVLVVAHRRKSAGSSRRRPGAGQPGVHRHRPRRVAPDAGHREQGPPAAAAGQEQPRPRGRRVGVHDHRAASRRRSRGSASRCT